MVLAPSSWTHLLSIGPLIHSNLTDSNDALFLIKQVAPSLSIPFHHTQQLEQFLLSHPMKSFTSDLWSSFFLFEEWYVKASCSLATYHDSMPFHSKIDEFVEFLRHF